MGGFFPGAEFIDTEIVDTDKFHFVIGTKLGPALVQVNKIFVKGGLGIVMQELGIVGFEQQSLGAGRDHPGQNIGGDGGDAATVGDKGRAVKMIERDFFDAAAVGVEMPRGIDVSADMDGRMDHRDGGGITLVKIALEAALVRHIFGIGRHPFGQGQGNVVNDRFFCHRNFVKNTAKILWALTGYYQIGRDV